MGTAFALKQRTARPTVQALLEGYETSQNVKARFLKLPFASFDLDASISLALHEIGFSIAPLVIPTLLRAVRRSNGWNGLKLVPALLFFTFGDQKVTRTMNVSDLTDLQREALTAIYETKKLWELGNMAYAVGDFFDPRFPELTFSSWYRKDVGAFLAGEKVFYD